MVSFPKGHFISFVAIESVEDARLAETNSGETARERERTSRRSHAVQIAEKAECLYPIPKDREGPPQARTNQEHSSLRNGGPV